MLKLQPAHSKIWDRGDELEELLSKKEWDLEEWKISQEKVCSGEKTKDLTRILFDKEITDVSYVFNQLSQQKLGIEMEL